MQQVRAIQFNPGVQKDRSPLASEPGWIDSQWIRFRAEKPEAMGGYTAFTGTPDLSAAALASHSWNDLDGNQWLAFGTAANLYAVDSSGTVVDITPEFTAVGVWKSASVKETNGSTTYTVTAYKSITYAAGDTVPPDTYNEGDEKVAATPVYEGHGLTNGQTVYLPWIDATKTVAVISEFVFTYTDTASGGTATTNYTEQYFYTTGGFASVSGWSLGNFGENLVALAQDSFLYQWEPNTTSSESIQDGDFDASANWTTSANWSITTGSPGYAAFSGAITGSDTVSQVLGTPVTPGRLYRVEIEIASEDAGFDVYLELTSGSTWHELKRLDPVLVAGGTTYRTYTFFTEAPANTEDNELDFTDFRVRLVGAGTVDVRVRNISIGLPVKALTVQSAPSQSRAMFVDPNRLVVLLGTVGAGGAYNGLNVRWCSQENINYWFPTTTNLAGEVPLSTGTRLVGGIVARGQNILFTEHDAQVMQFTGDPATVFSIRPLAANCGLIARRAAARDGMGNVYWWSNEGQFFRFSGGAVEAIPCTVLRDVMENFDTTLTAKIHTGHNPAFREIFWFYPDTRDSATDVTRYVKLNYDTGVWDTGAFVCTAYEPQGTYQNPVAVDGDGDIFLMENGNDANGADLECSITSSFFDIEDGGNLTALQRIIPDFDDQQGPVSFQINTKQYPNSDAKDIAKYTAQTNTPKLDMRHSARQVQFIISSNSDPTFWRLGALRMDMRKTGSRR